MEEGPTKQTKVKELNRYGAHDRIAWRPRDYGGYVTMVAKGLGGCEKRGMVVEQVKGIN